MALIASSKSWARAAWAWWSRLKTPGWPAALPSDGGDKELAHDPQYRDRFLRERGWWPRFSTITFFQSTTSAKKCRPYLVMPLVPGRDLDKRLEQEKPLLAGEVIRLGREMALGLAATHAKGLIHRDIKPSNVWLEELTSGPKASDRVGGIEAALRG